jgi:hypothetical protein
MPGPRQASTQPHPSAIRAAAALRAVLPPSPATRVTSSASGPATTARPRTGGPAPARSAPARAGFQIYHHLTQAVAAKWLHATGFDPAGRRRPAPFTSPGTPGYPISPS